jgi:hypothetical protein
VVYTLWFLSASKSVFFVTIELCLMWDPTSVPCVLSFWRWAINPTTFIPVSFLLSDYLSPIVTLLHICGHGQVWGSRHREKIEM